MADDLVQQAADAAHTAAHFKNGGVIGGAATFTIFNMSPSDFAMVATGIAACISAFVAIAGLLVNWYWKKREHELKKRETEE